MKLLKSIGLAALTFAVTGSGGVLYQVSLPSGASVNAQGGARSNFDWINCGPQNYPACTNGGGVAAGGFIYGDAFTLAPGSSYLITSITVFAAGNQTNDTPTSFAAEFSAINLYFGPYADQTSACSATIGGGNGTCSFSIIGTNPTITAASYTGGVASPPGSNCTAAGQSSYLARDNSSCLPIFQVTFNVNQVVQGGAKYEFGADGALIPALLTNDLTACVGPCGWYTLASTSGNGVFGWDGTDLTGGSFPTPTNPNTLMNVIIAGNAVPEPASFLLSGLGIAAIGVIAIRRRRNARNDLS